MEGRRDSRNARADSSGEHVVFAMQKAQLSANWALRHRHVRFAEVTVWLAARTVEEQLSARMLSSRQSFCARVSEGRGLEWVG